jgi:uncharacterized protein (DUF58 family)
VPKAEDRTLLDPVHLNRISDLALLSHVVVDGAMPGLHRSLRQGRGNEFFQYRSYEPGEDLKVVDWKVYARSDELVAKSYQEDTNFTVFLVIDASASMGYQGRETTYSKLRYASMIASCLAYMAHRQGDQIGLFGYGEETQQWIRPASGSGHFQRILQGIASLEAKGKTMHEKAWEQLSMVLPGRSMVIFLSDFLEAEETLTENLRFSLSSYYQSLCLQILDPLEISLPDEEALRFTEMEGVREISTSPAVIRSQYQAEMESFIQKLRNSMASISAEFETLTTDQDLGHALRRFLGLRNAAR